MPIDKIRFEKLFPTVQYGNELFVMECSLGPGETVEGLYDMMSQIAVAQFSRNNPNLTYQNTAPLINEPLPEIQVEKIIEQKETNYADIIAKCKTIEELASWKLVIPADLKPAYVIKLKSLTQSINV